MADRGNIILHYRGGEADLGEIGYYTAATSMLAFGDFIGAMSRATYGDGVKVETKVSSISPSGSISFEFWVYATAIGQAALFGPVTPDVIWNVLKDGIDAWKFLGGKPPESIKQEGDSFAITNIKGDVKYFSQNVTVLLNDSKAGDAIEQLIKKPMEQAGITEVSIEEKEKNETVTIDYEDRECFTDVSRDHDILESTVERALYIESVKFREGNKWEFHDGQSRLSAAIKDEEFLARINNGEPFAKGDMLLVDLHSVQKFRRGKLIVQHEIIRVKEHRKRLSQLTIGE